MQEDVCRLYVNTTQSYMRDWSILGVWYPWGVLEATPTGDCNARSGGHCTEVLQSQKNLGLRM
jgi:hypothetical protein